MLSVNVNRMRHMYAALRQCHLNLWLSTRICWPRSASDGESHLCFCVLSDGDDECKCITNSTRPSSLEREIVSARKYSMWFMIKLTRDNCCHIDVKMWKVVLNACIGTIALHSQISNGFLSILITAKIRYRKRRRLHEQKQFCSKKKTFN